MRTCTDEMPAVLPSVQLLAKGLLADGKDDIPPRQTYSRIRDSLRPLQGCSHAPHGADSPAPPIIVGDHTIGLEPSLTSQRLVYRIPYRLKEGRRRPKVRIGNAERPLFDHESALTVLTGDVDDKFLHGAVIVIGGTYAETRDWYATPVGDMPGAMVIVNAIDSLRAHGQY